MGYRWGSPPTPPLLDKSGPHSANGGSDQPWGTWDPHISSSGALCKIFFAFLTFFFARKCLKWHFWPFGVKNILPGGECQAEIQSPGPLHCLGRGGVLLSWTGVGEGRMQPPTCPCIKPWGIIFWRSQFG